MERPRQTPFDYVVAAISPALIIALVGSLVYFLTAVFYQGDFETRLLFILGMFVMAAVLIGRLAITEGGGYATMFAIPLAIVTGLAMMKFVEVRGIPALSWAFNWSMIALVWWCSHKLTKNCTLIDDSEDASGEGLLQSFGWDRPDSEKKGKSSEAASPAPIEAELTAAAVTAPANAKSKRRRRGASDRDWEQVARDRAELKKKRRTAPGVWVIFFSLAALPIFGIGQGFIDANDLPTRRFAFWMMCIYILSGLGLLLTTSLLGLRRYLRQRMLEMPVEMTGAWLSVGALLIVGLLAAVWILPRPSPEYSISHIASPFRSPDGLRASRQAVGNDAAEEGESQAAGQSSEGQKSEVGGQQGGSQQQGGGQQGGGQQGGGQRSEGQKSEAGGQQGGSQQQGGGQQGGGQQGGGQRSEGQKSEAGGQQGGSQQQGGGQSQSGGQQSGQQQSGQQQSGQQQSGQQQSGQQQSGQGQSNQGQSNQGQNNQGQNDQGQNDQGQSNQGQNDSKQSGQGSSQPPPGSQQPLGSNERSSPQQNSSPQNQRSGSMFRDGGQNDTRPQQPSESENAETESTESADSSRGPSLAGVANGLWEFLAGMLKFIYYLIFAAIAAFFIWKYRRQLIEGWRALMAQIKAFLSGLRGRKGEESPALAEGENPLAPPKPFADFADPFASGAAARWSAEELVRYSFQALEAWARERGCARRPEQTAWEFADSLGRAPSLGPAAGAVAPHAAGLADLYSRAAYARGPLPPTTPDLLRRLWQSLAASV